MSSKSKVPDAWDDDWVNQADVCLMRELTYVMDLILYLAIL